MMEDIRNYRFDFRPEAATLLAGLGKVGKRIVVLETDIEPYAHDGKPRMNFPCIVCDDGLMKKYALKFRDVINQKITERQSKGSHCVTISKDLLRGEYYYISLQPKSQFAGHLGEGNRALMNLFTLYHEAAHTLIHGRLIDDSVIYKECAADAYAALKLLQRFGAGITPFLSQLSWLRTHEAITQNASHLSTTVIDKIILDSTTCDFSCLTQPEIVRMAKSYAKTFRPKPSALTKAEKVFKHVRMDMPDIANVIRSSAIKFSVDDFTFSLLAKEASVFKPGELVYDGKNWKPKNAKYHEEMQADVSSRVAGMCLRDMFNSKALTPAQKETPLADVLKVRLFPWQQQFIYQPKKFAHKA